MALVRAVQNISASMLGERSRALHRMVSEVGRVPCIVSYPAGGTVGRHPLLPRSATLASRRIPCHASPTPGLTLTAAPLLGGAQGAARAPGASGSPAPSETPAGGPPALPCLHLGLDPAFYLLRTFATAVAVHLTRRLVPAHRGGRRLRLPTKEFIHTDA
jgi:hypothetical protein